MNAVHETGLPAASAIEAWAVGAGFHDAWSTPLADPTLSPAEIFLRSARSTPRWVETAMAWRNRLVRLLGLKDVGAMDAHSLRPAATVRVGDRLGIFQVFGMAENELLLGIDDSHLDVRVSVWKSPAGVAPACVVSTAVKVHNLLGRLYMLPVGRIHPWVVKAMLRHAPI